MPTVLVTGANRGIGLALARQYADEGWAVIATSRDPRQADELNKLSGDVTVEALEVTDLDAVRDLAARLKGTAIDVLFNNAGIAGRESGTLGSLDSDVWLKTLHVNTVAPLMLAEAFVDHVAASGQKRMAFVSSQLGSIADNRSGGRYAYRSSKAALNMAVKSLSADLRDRGISVCVLHPGHVATDMGGHSAPKTPDDSAREMRAAVADLKPAESGRFLNYDGKPIPW